jgi:hypothetical protein
LVVVLPATIAGCAKSGTVAGKASVDGQPVNGGSVSFLGADVELGTRNSSTGNIQADGSYEVRDVPVGPTKVCIIPPITTGVGPAVRPRDRERGLPPNGKAAAPTPTAAPVPIPPKYTKYDTSGLILTVHGGQNPFNIEMTSK